MNLPNIITISRLLLTPYIVWLILSESYFLGFIFFLLSGFNLPIPVDDRSLAMPLIPRQSALLGVIETSIIFSDFLLL